MFFMQCQYFHMKVILDMQGRTWFTKAEISGWTKILKFCVVQGTAHKSLNTYDQNDFNSQSQIT